VDLYRPILAKAIFPAFEALRGRPTVPLLRYVQHTERWPLDALRDLQTGQLKRLVRHAYRHTAHYRELLDDAGLVPDDIESVADLARIPLLTKAVSRATVDARTSDAPPFPTIVKMTSGSSGEPVVIKYNDESRHWRDAMRWRGYGWSGYEIGMRALHYWGFGPKSAAPWWKRKRADIDHAWKRDLFIDCTPRSEAALSDAVAQLRRFRPHILVTYAGGVAALARFVNDRSLRAWQDIPVLTGAEALPAADRAQIEQAFGPVFETYGCREFMLLGSECEAHAGLHTSMENLVVEILVDGRPAKPGEVGEVTVTDLHNLGCPMIRYQTGDLATAGDDSVCACGRTLPRIRNVQGRLTETLRDGAGNAVSGLTFNVVMAVIGTQVKVWQVVQRRDRSLVFKVVTHTGAPLPQKDLTYLSEYAAKYLPGVPLTVEYVPEIPLSAMGKRRSVVVEV
jgi:phenylacetate-CoA ligase